MTNFITDIDNTEETTQYHLIFNTDDKEVFLAMQTFARRMIDKGSIKTNYDYLCTLTPEEMSHCITSIIETSDEKAADKLRDLGLDVTIVSLAHDIQAAMHLEYLNQPYIPTQEEEYDYTDSE